MGLVNNDQVVVGYGYAGIVTHNLAHHALHSCNLQTGFDIKAFFAEFLYGEHLVQCQVILQLYLRELFLGLFAKEISVHKEQDPLEPFGSQQAIDQSQCHAGFPCSGRHGNENCLFTFDDGFFGFLDRSKLMIIEIQSIRITQGIIRRVLQLGICLIGFGVEPVGNTLRAWPATEGAPVFHGKPSILKPDS